MSMDFSQGVRQITFGPNNSNFIYGLGVHEIPKKGYTPRLFYINNSNP